MFGKLTMNLRNFTSHLFLIYPDDRECVLVIVHETERWYYCIKDSLLSHVYLIDCEYNLFIYCAWLNKTEPYFLLQYSVYFVTTIWSELSDYYVVDFQYCRNTRCDSEGMTRANVLYTCGFRYYQDSTDS